MDRLLPVPAPVDLQPLAGNVSDHWTGQKDNGNSPTDISAAAGHKGYFAR